MSQANIVYVVTIDLHASTGRDSILGVFDSKNKAEEAVDYFTKTGLDFFHIRDKYSIEEYELNRKEGY